MEPLSKSLNNSLYLHAFNLVPQFGPARLIKICRYFDNPQTAFETNEDELLRAGLETEIIQAFFKVRQNFNSADELEKLNILDIKLLCYLDEAYPKLLLEISKFPPLLYYKGIMAGIEELCVAAVGTRKITNYGRIVVPYITQPLIDLGVTMVSGLAYGVDSAVQKLAADSGKRTIAVLANGLDEKTFYPKDHIYLADQIIATGGALLSEYPPGTPPLKHHFIARNRIISGLSVATIIIECNIKSGSLITAKYALEQNRTVYAVPGQIYAPESQGPNNLIKMGAKLITRAEDILDDLNIKTLPADQRAQDTFGDTPVETTLLQLISLEPIAVDLLIKLSELEAGEVISALTFLEMKGKVRNLGAQQYARSR
jgi:DNA processing protein